MFDEYFSKKYLFDFFLFDQKLSPPPHIIFFIIKNAHLHFTKLTPLLHFYPTGFT